MFEQVNQTSLFLDQTTLFFLTEVVWVLPTKIIKREKFLLFVFTRRGWKKGGTDNKIKEGREEKSYIHDIEI